MSSTYAQRRRDEGFSHHQRTISQEMVQIWRIKKQELEATEATEDVKVQSLAFLDCALIDGGRSLDVAAWCCTLLFSFR